MNLDKLISNNKTEDSIFCFTNTFSYEENIDELIINNNLTRFDCTTLLKFNIGDNIIREELTNRDKLEDKYFALLYIEETGRRVSYMNLSYNRLILKLTTLSNVIQRSVIIYNMENAIKLSEEAIKEFNRLNKLDDRKIYSIAEFAELLGVTTQTLRNWDKNGTLKPLIQTDGGRQYTFEQSLEYFKKYSKKDTELKGIGYVVKSSEQEEYERKIKDYFKSIKCEEYTIYEDIEGIEKDRNYLGGIITEVLKGKVDCLVLVWENNAIDLGNIGLFEMILNKCGCKLIIL